MAKSLKYEIKMLDDELLSVKLSLLQIEKALTLDNLNYDVKAIRSFKMEHKECVKKIKSIEEKLEKRRKAAEAFYKKDGFTY